MNLSLPLLLLAATLAPAQTPELAGLKLRAIGPANMSGRVVDIAVVEKDPIQIYAASVSDSRGF